MIAILIVLTALLFIRIIYLQTDRKYYIELEKSNYNIYISTANKLKTSLEQEKQVNNRLKQIIDQEKKSFASTNTRATEEYSRLSREYLELNQEFQTYKNKVKEEFKLLQCNMTDSAEFLEGLK